MFLQFLCLISTEKHSCERVNISHLIKDQSSIIKARDRVVLLIKLTVQCRAILMDKQQDLDGQPAKQKYTILIDELEKCQEKETVGEIVLWNCV